MKYVEHNFFDTHDIGAWVANRTVRGSLSAHDLSSLRDMIEMKVGMAEDAMRCAAPALHVTFDDAEGDAAMLITPPLHVRYGSSVDRISMVVDADMEFPEIRRALGSRLADLFDGYFKLSTTLKEAGLEGITELREMAVQDSKASPSWSPAIPEDMGMEP